jgi:5-formyltetrahydrofolate cyclo-ligase
MSMTVSIQTAKQQIREEMKAQREVLTEKEYLELSSRVCDRLESLSFFSEAKTIAAYYPVHHEVDILQLLKKSIENGKKILLPRILGEPKISLDFAKVTDLELETGPYGIPQPPSAAVSTPLSEIDILLMNRLWQRILRSVAQKTERKNKNGRCFFHISNC